MARKILILRRHMRLPASKKALTATSVVFIIIAIGASELIGITHLIKKSPSLSTEVVTVGTPVIAPQQDTPADTQPVEKMATNNTSGAQGGVVDTGGSVSPTSDSSQWVTSKSGYITVKSPSANAKLVTGGVLSGSAKIEEINYRLIDNVVGVVTQGTLSVVNGNFSGSLQFNPKGTGGRLDVFSTDSQGVEYNEVQINVGF